MQTCSDGICGEPVRLLSLLLFLYCLAMVVPVAMCEETPKIAPDGLVNPCGVAVQPDTGDVFVSESVAGRVLRLVDGKAEDVITGFPQEPFGDSASTIGSLGLAFLDRDTLVVGGGGHADGGDVIRIYKVPNRGAAAISHEAVTQSLGPLDASGAVPGEDDLFAVAATGKAIFATAYGDDTKGWVVKANRNGGGFGALQRFIATKDVVGVDAPFGLTVSDQGHLVVGQMGEITAPKDSLLCFYDASSGKLLLNLETGLHDIIGLAYGPQGHLYALDFASLDTTQGGLFRLDAQDNRGQQTVKAVRIASLDKPTSLAFGGDGALYVTVIGAAGQTNDKPGKLLKFAPGCEDILWSAVAWYRTPKSRSGIVDSSRKAFHDIGQVRGFDGRALSTRRNAGTRRTLRGSGRPRVPTWCQGDLSNRPRPGNRRGAYQTDAASIPRQWNTIARDDGRR